MKRGMNKKGAEMNVNTIIVIILAIVVLVVVVLWFTGGLQKLFGGIRTQTELYGLSAIGADKSYCENEGMSVVDFCTKKVPLDNQVNKTTDYFYCYEKPIQARLSYTDPATGTKVSVGSADKCSELGYPSE